MIKYKITTETIINLTMFQMLGKNKEKTVYSVLFTLILTWVILVTIFFKNDKEIVSQKTNTSQPNEDITLIKEFFLQKIKSPFINIDYEIKSGDSIQKILKKLKIQNKEIQSVITQYKKYGNANQLLAGNKINIIIKENLSNKNHSIIKFSIPVTKSIIIEISKNNLLKIRKTFEAYKLDDNGTLQNIKKVYNDTGRIIDPHSSVGFYSAIEAGKKSSVPIVTLATAHPSKFPQAVRTAIKIKAKLPRNISDSLERKEKYDILPNDFDLVKNYISTKSSFGG